ncbi:hypothetical protein CMV_000739 [Castanea mollissima]|uniref:Uncharacterized protein n=1 Tax=Castanea mollissima TaxID=60419 RepID=A0A8J4RWN4_9ROSI|nr:hypothetical protein CMV_000739 [Castanea mollissima]
MQLSLLDHLKQLLGYVDKKELETRWQEISVESVASAVGWAVHQDEMGLEVGALGKRLNIPLGPLEA